MVSEGSGQNVMLVRDGVLITTPVDGTILQGITRASVLAIAHDLGIEVREVAIPREMLYTADELFFTGTAAEVTPIRSIDRIQVGDGTAGPSRGGCSSGSSPLSRARSRTRTAGSRTSGRRPSRV
jgi:branched-chain amino acid aminotransferase